jgi:G:T-mismatch repair DNA endonuclease (very short patch repair protein)
MNDINLPTLFCKRCFHKWIPRANKLPDVCPRCNSPYWNKERRQNMKKREHDLGELTELSYETRGAPKETKEKKK